MSFTLGNTNIFSRNYAPVNAQSHDGNTPLHPLCKSEEINDVQQKIRLVEKLLDGPGNLEVNANNNEGCRPIFFACTACEVDLLRFLVEKCKADLSYKSYVSLLHVVLEKKDKTVIGEEAIKSKQEECMINFLPLIF